jgi:flagellar protein FlbT
MGLHLSLKPNEKVIVNGCVLRNTNRRQALIVETRADVIREADLLKPDDAATPVKQVYFFIQSVLLRPDIRDQIVPEIQKNLGKLALVFEDRTAGHIFEAANHVSAADYYKALKSLRKVMEREAELLEKIGGSLLTPALVETD